MHVHPYASGCLWFADERVCMQRAVKPENRCIQHKAAAVEKKEIQPPAAATAAESTGLPIKTPGIPMTAYSQGI